MNGSLIFRISFISTLAAAALFAFGCSASGGGGGAVGGGPSGGSQQPLAISTPSPMPRAVVGQSYSFALQASGGTAPYTWSIPQGTGFLPDGMSLSTSGLISGTPAPDGSCLDMSPMFQVQDARGATASQRLELLCVIPLAFVNGSYFPSGNVGLPYTGGVDAVGGVQPYTFSLVSSSAPLPSGLSFVAQPTAGIIQGTPATYGDVTVTIKVADSGTPQFTAMQSFDLNIRNDLIVAPAVFMPIGVQNISYSEAVPVVGGTPPYHWSPADQFQMLPVGLSLNGTTGLVHGIPTVIGITGYLVQVTDSTKPTPIIANGTISFDINPMLKLDTVVAHDGTIQQPYGINFNLEGGRPPYSGTNLTGALPDGTAILPSSTSMSGTPTKDGLFQFTMQFSDSYNPPNTIQQAYQIRISDSLVMSAPNLPPVIEGQSFSGTFLASGGFPPYSWSANSVPAGLTFDATTGTVSGTAGSLGRGVVSSSESIFVTLQDSSNPPFTMSMWWGLEVFAKLRIETSFFPAIATGSNIWLTPVFDGGVPPLQWMISSGSLPPVTTLNTKDGTISGTPSTAGSYPVTLSLSDNNPPPLAQVASKSFTLIVKDRSQLGRNDTIAQATPISNGYFVGSISPFSDSSSSGPDVDVYQLTAPPGALVDLLVNANVIAIQPPAFDALLPLLEVVDANGQRYQNCSQPQATFDVGPYTYACINGLDGNFSSSASYTFQVPGAGTQPVTFYVRILDARGDARPDFIYTLVVAGAS